MEKAIEKRTVTKEEPTKFFGNCKDTMTMSTCDKFGEHVKRTKLIVHVPTGRTEPTFTTKRNIFEFATIRAWIESPAIRWITTMNHLVHVFYNSGTWFKIIKDMFIIVIKNRL